MPTGKKVLTLDPHQESKALFANKKDGPPFAVEIKALAFSKDGQRLAIAEFLPNKDPPADRRVIEVWDVKAGNLLQTLTGDMVNILFMGFNSDGTRLVSAAGDQTLCLWDLESGTALHSVKGPGEGRLLYMAFSPAGERLAYLDGSKMIHVFDTATLKTYLPLSGHAAEVTRVTFSADGKILGSASRDHTVKVWDPTTGQTLRSF